MTDSEEQAYLDGQRSILRRQLRNLMKELGYQEEQDDKAWAVEREDVIASLQSLCRQMDIDGSWDPEDYLADTIDKRIIPFLNERPNRT